MAFNIEGFDIPQYGPVSSVKPSADQLEARKKMLEQFGVKSPQEMVGGMAGGSGSGMAGLLGAGGAAASGGTAAAGTAAAGGAAGAGAAGALASL